MRVMTCNIRTSLARDGTNDWELRKEFCAQVIRSRHPDLVGFQEVSCSQLDHLREFLPEFDVYQLRDASLRDNPTNALFYRRDEFEFVTGGGYWLSQTPHIPGSVSWGSKHVRLANWVRLKQKESGTEFRFVNTHLDVASREARQQQARLINEDAESYAPEYPQILTGDMNADHDSPPIKAFKSSGWRDTYEALNGPQDPGFTVHGFKGPDSDHEETGKIDFIFTRGALNVISTEIIQDKNTLGRYPSDHYFVSAVVKFARLSGDVTTSQTYP